GVASGINESQNALGIQLLSNPVKQSLEIRSEENFREAELKIFNAEGRLMNSKNIYLNTGANFFDVNSLQAGIYFLKISSENKSSSIRFVKL
ncbi:MAG: T9SS type A sorting domain-containing protein, partial [Bacteroidia bacterium]|nr:T9SS type A sorting domain-containing protein [Bacteroidia bacterium]